jgi:hypothetical protein
MSSIPSLKLKNSTKQYFKKAKIKEHIINEVQQLPDFNKDLKFDNEIIEAVLQIINNKFYKKSTEEKKEYAINILKDLFILSDDEINIISKIINYMYENKIIKKPSKVFKYGEATLHFILKKVL